MTARPVALHDDDRDGPLDALVRGDDEDIAPVRRLLDGVRGRSHEHSCRHGQTLFAQATNYGPSATTRRLDIYLDGTLFNAYNLTAAYATARALGLGSTLTTRHLLYEREAEAAASELGAAYLLLVDTIARSLARAHGGDVVSRAREQHTPAGHGARVGDDLRRLRLARQALHVAVHRVLLVRPAAARPRASNPVADPNSDIRIHATRDRQDPAARSEPGETTSAGRAS